MIARWFAFAERGTDAATEVRATNYLLALAPGMGLNAVVASSWWRAHVVDHSTASARDS